MKYSKLAAVMLMVFGAFFCIAPRAQAMEVFSLPGQALNDTLTHVYYRGGVRHGGGYRHGYRGGGYRHGYRGGGYRYGYRGGVVTVTRRLSRRLLWWWMPLGVGEWGERTPLLLTSAERARSLSE